MIVIFLLSLLYDLLDNYGVEIPSFCVYIDLGCEHPSSLLARGIVYLILTHVQWSRKRFSCLPAEQCNRICVMIDAVNEEIGNY